GMEGPGTADHDRLAAKFRLIRQVDDLVGLDRHAGHHHRVALVPVLLGELLEAQVEMPHLPLLREQRGDRDQAEIGLRRLLAGPGHDLGIAGDDAAGKRRQQQQNAAMAVSAAIRWMFGTGDWTTLLSTLDRTHDKHPVTNASFDSNLSRSSSAAYLAASTR